MNVTEKFVGALIGLFPAFIIALIGAVLWNTRHADRIPELQNSQEVILQKLEHNTRGIAKIEGSIGVNSVILDAHERQIGELKQRLRELERKP